jgi:hypothetical protein
MRVGRRGLFSTAGPRRSRSRRRDSGYRVFVSLFGAVACSASAFAAEPAAKLKHATAASVTRGFAFEIEAQRHCPTDRVVWIDPSLRIFNEEGERWYGRTKGGAFMCWGEAGTTGYRPARR